MTAEILAEKTALLKKRAVDVTREHWGYVLAGTLLAVVLTIVIHMVVKRRRRTYFERALDYIEELGERREKIARNLKEFVADKADASGVSKALDGALKAIRRELASVEKSLKNAGK